MHTWLALWLPHLCLISPSRLDTPQSSCPQRKTCVVFVCVCVLGGVNEYWLVGCKCKARAACCLSSQARLPDAKAKLQQLHATAHMPALSRLLPALHFVTGQYSLWVEEPLLAAQHFQVRAYGTHMQGAHLGMLAGVGMSALSALG